MIRMGEPSKHLRHRRKAINLLREELKNIHYRDASWVRLKPTDEGTYFYVEPDGKELGLTMEAGPRVRIRVHPSGRSINDQDNFNELVNYITINVYFKDDRGEPSIIYKWESGDAGTLKKNDEYWEQCDFPGLLCKIFDDLVRHHR